jgi:DinB superfamily
VGRDVENDRGAAEELFALGYRSVPVVILPGRAPITGFNVAALSAAIGAVEGAPAAEPDVLWKSLDRVLAAVIAAAGQLRPTDLDVVIIPSRDRTMRELIHDVFYKALLWIDDRSHPEAGPAPDAAPAVTRRETRQKDDAARYREPAALAEYGRKVSARLHRRFCPNLGADYRRVIDTPEGRMTIAEAVGWLVSHSAHHLRQMYWVMEHRLRMKPAEPLALSTLPGVSLPGELW